MAQYVVFQIYGLLDFCKYVKLFRQTFVRPNSAWLKSHGTILITSASAEIMFKARSSHFIWKEEPQKIMRDNFSSFPAAMQPNKNIWSMEFFRLTGDLIGPLDKLECSFYKTKCFQLKNGRVQTGFRGEPIRSLQLLLLAISTFDPVLAALAQSDI